MEKVGEKATPEEVTTEEEYLRRYCFFYGKINLGTDNYLKT